MLNPVVSAEALTVSPRMPSLFVSHGAPDLPLQDCPARDFLQQLGIQLPNPKGILVISPHWMTSVPTVSTALRQRSAHDYGGFSRALRNLHYTPPSDLAIAQQVMSLLQVEELAVAEDPSHNLDHGAWVPLLLMYPKAEIPVTQLSLPAHWTAEQLLKLGQALAPLRGQGILILASGSATHNLWAFGGQGVDATPPEWVAQFEDWLVRVVERGDRAQLLAYETAPGFRENHPTPEHLLPLFVALGAGPSARPGKCLHRSYTYGIFSMAAFRFGSV